MVIWDSNQQKGLHEIANDFTNETGIRVRIRVESWDSYWTMLDEGASGGDMPDVFWTHSNNAQMYMKDGTLLDLTDYIDSSSEIDMSNYMPEITELYTLDSHYYAIPKDYDTVALWYNRTMFDEAGISYPDDTWTWYDLLDAARRLTKADGSQYGFAMTPHNDQDTYYNMVYSMGGYILNEDWTKSGYDDENTLKAMDYVAVLPYDKTTGKRVSLVNGLGWAASAQTDRPDDCWKLIEYFGSKEAQLKQAQTGITMSAYEGTSDDWADSTDRFNLQPYLDEATQDRTGGGTNILVLRPYTYNSTRWANMASKELLNVWKNPTHENMESTCKDIAGQMNDMISQENQ